MKNLAKITAFLLLAFPLWAQVQLGGNVQVSGTVLICSTPSAGTVATPTASPAAGSYSSTQSVTLSTSTGGAAICYTNDGSTPTATPGTCTHGTTYSTAINVSSTQTIKAIGTLASYTNSGILTAAYTITGSGTATPILVPFATPLNTGNYAVTIPPGGFTSANGTIPQALAFGNQGTGTASMAIPISISNCSNSAMIPACSGSGTLTVSGMAISGPNAGDFTLTGSCTTIASGADCEPTITFTPTASSGTNETATLTVTDNGATATQTLPLTGTSATVTSLSTCLTALSGSTNYQLASNLACAGNDFTMGAVGNVDLNLNGHTLTYCNSATSLSSTVTAYSANGTDVTFTGNNSFIAGDTTYLNFTAGPTYLSGQIGTILTTGLSSTQFEIANTYTAGSGSVTGTAISGQLAGAVLVNGGATGPLTVHNGTIVHGAGSCPGITVGGVGGSGAIVTSSSGSSSNADGVSLSNLDINIGDEPFGKVVYAEYGANASVVHDISYVNNNSYQCGNVGCRAEDQGYSLDYVDSADTPGSTFYDISGVGGPQGGITTSASNATEVYNEIAPGNEYSTFSNGFIFQDWGNQAVVSYNLTTMSMNAYLSTRGTQLAAATTNIENSEISYNYFVLTNLPNDLEYGGCQGGGTYVGQINALGTDKEVSGNKIEHNWFQTINNVCSGVAFSFSNGTNGDGPNQINYNHFEADRGTGSTAYPSAGFQSLAHEYSPAPDGSIIGSGNTILGDTSAIYIGYDGTTTYVGTNDTYGQGSNPSGSYVMFDNDSGYESGNSSSLFTLSNPTFIGTTKSSNNLAAFAASNPSLSSSYVANWPYTVTVEKASNSAPITGATVTGTDTDSTVECNTTTNSSGVAVCTLNDTKYQAVTGTYSTPSYNPFAMVISASGCTTDSYSLTITSALTPTIKLSGC